MLRLVGHSNMAVRLPRQLYATIQRLACRLMERGDLRELREWDRARIVGSHAQNL